MEKMDFVLSYEVWIGPIGHGLDFRVGTQVVQIVRISDVKGRVYSSAPNTIRPHMF
jgi:hypothetical protein